jgi:uncharacterized protein YjbJ (UPF0337 family)
MDFIKEQTMSTGTENTAKGKYDEVAGKVKQGVGEAVNNDRLANQGTAQQVKGHGEQAWGSVKQTAEDTHEQKAHDVRESITSTARNAKENLEDATRGSNYRDDRR